MRKKERLPWQNILRCWLLWSTVGHSHTCGRLEISPPTYLKYCHRNVHIVIGRFLQCSIGKLTRSKILGYELSITAGLFKRLQVHSPASHSLEKVNVRSLHAHPPGPNITPIFETTEIQDLHNKYPTKNQVHLSMQEVLVEFRFSEGLALDPPPCLILLGPHHSRSLFATSMVVSYKASARYPKEIQYLLI